MGQQRSVPAWLPYVDLACAVTAGAAWYIRPEWGPWPLALVLAPWIMRLILTKRPTRHTPFDLPLVLFLATAGMGVWAAFHKETAWAKFWIIVGAVAIYYALANQPTASHLRAFVTLYALFGAGIAAYFLWTNNWTHGKAKIDALNEWGKAIQAMLPPFSGHPMQPNVVGGMLAMIMPFQLVVLLGNWGKSTEVGSGKRVRWEWVLERGLVAIALALTSFALLLTTSRGAWLALAVGLAVWLLWKASEVTTRPLPQGHKGSEDDRSRDVSPGVLGTSSQKTWWRFLTLVAVVVAVLGGVLLLFPGGPQGVLVLLPGQNQLPGRVSLWERAVYLIQDMPLTGGGLGSFPALDSAYTYPITDWIRYRVFLWVTNFHSHNLWLDMALEQGLPGLVALLWLQGAFVATTCRWGRRAQSQDSDVGLLVQAAVVSALVVALHAVVDDVPYGSRAMLLFFVPMGVMAAQAAPHCFPPRLRERMALAIPTTTLILGLAAIAWGRPLMAAWQADLGTVEQAKIELAGYLNEGYDLYLARAEGDFNRAIAHFEQALALEPEQPTANLRLGLIRLGQGEYEASLPLLDRAYRAQQGRQAAHQALAEACLAAGRLEESAALWDGVDEAEAKLKQLNRWYQVSDDETRATNASQIATMVAHE